MVKRPMAETASEAPPLTSGDTSPASEWTRSSRRELIGRVVQSPSFAKSERLSALLTYVCEMSLKGRAGELNEQRIGHAVFGRKLDYDSSADGIVRTQASRLRQRLDQHFRGEGAHEAIRIEIPKGGYVPVFKEQASLAPHMESAVVETAPATVHEPVVTHAGTSRWLTWLPWLLCGVFALFAGAGWLRPSRQAVPLPQPHPLWSKVFNSARPTLEVPGDSGLVLSYLFTQRGVSLSEYLAGHYRLDPSTGQTTDVQSIPMDIANRRYTSIVDLAIAVDLERMAAARASSLQIRYARDLRPNDLKSGNAVLVGAFEGNPWLGLFEPRMKFRLVNNYRGHVFSVLNASPKAGEPDHWEATAGDPLKRVYGVIALMPNLSGNGNVLIVEGTSMAGVEAAWDFVSDDDVLLPLLRRMQKPDGSVPSFEILVGTQNMGASASHADLVAWVAH